MKRAADAGHGRRPNKHSRRVDASSIQIVPVGKSEGLRSRHEWSGPANMSLVDILPDEILPFIVKSAAHPSFLCNCARISRAWRDACSDTVMDQEAWLALCGGAQATKKLHSVFWADFLIKYFPDVCPNQTDIMKQIAADPLLSTPRQLYSKIMFRRQSFLDLPPKGSPGTIVSSNSPSTHEAYHRARCGPALVDPEKPTLYVTLKECKNQYHNMIGGTVANVVDESGYADDAVRETFLLMQLQGHPRVVRLYSTFVDKETTCLVLSAFDATLETTIARRKKNPQPQSAAAAAKVPGGCMPGIVCRRDRVRYSRQIVEAVAFLHSKGIMHGNIAAKKFLVNPSGDLELCTFDFGCECTTMVPSLGIRSSDTGGVLTHRAPELLLGSETYSHKADVWSVGCVLAQMFRGSLVFRPKDIVPLSSAGKAEPELKEELNSFPSLHGLFSGEEQLRMLAGVFCVQGSPDCKVMEALSGYPLFPYLAQYQVDSQKHPEVVYTRAGGGVNGGGAGVTNGVSPKSRDSPDTQAATLIASIQAAQSVPQPQGPSPEYSRTATNNDSSNWRRQTRSAAQDSMLSIAPSPLQDVYPGSVGEPAREGITPSLGDDPLALDLINRMLCPDPGQRISAKDALAHPFFTQLEGLDADREEDEEEEEEEVLQYGLGLPAAPDAADMAAKALADELLLEGEQNVDQGRGATEGTGHLASSSHEGGQSNVNVLQAPPSVVAGAALASSSALLPAAAAAATTKAALPPQPAALPPLAAQPGVALVGGGGIKAKLTAQPRRSSRRVSGTPFMVSRTKPMTAAAAAGGGGGGSKGVTKPAPSPGSGNHGFTPSGIKAGTGSASGAGFGKTSAQQQQQQQITACPTPVPPVTGHFAVGGTAPPSSQAWWSPHPLQTAQVAAAAVLLGEGTSCSIGSSLSGMHRPRYGSAGSPHETLQCFSRRVAAAMARRGLRAARSSGRSSQVPAGGKAQGHVEANVAHQGSGAVVVAGATQGRAVVSNNNGKSAAQVQRHPSANHEQHHFQAHSMMKYPCNPHWYDNYGEELNAHVSAVQRGVLPDPYCMEEVQNEVRPWMRLVLTDWMVEVCQHNRFDPQSPVLYCAINYLDRFMSRCAVSRRELQLLGVAALLVACKLKRETQVTVSDLRRITDEAYSEDEIVAKEEEMLLSLDFNLYSPQPLTCIEYFSAALSKDVVFGGSTAAAAAAGKGGGAGGEKKDRKRAAAGGDGPARAEHGCAVGMDCGEEAGGDSAVAAAAVSPAVNSGQTAAVMDSTLSTQDAGMLCVEVAAACRQRAHYLYDVSMTVYSMLQFSTMENAAAAAAAAMSTIANPSVGGWEVSFFERLTGAGMDVPRVRCAMRQMHSLARWGHDSFPKGVYNKWCPTGSAVSNNGTPAPTESFRYVSSTVNVNAESVAGVSLSGGKGAGGGGGGCGGSMSNVLVPGTTMDLEQAEFVMNCISGIPNLAQIHPASFNAIGSAFKACGLDHPVEKNRWKAYHAIRGVLSGLCGGVATNEARYSMNGGLPIESNSWFYRPSDAASVRHALACAAKHDGGGGGGGAGAGAGSGGRTPQAGAVGAAAGSSSDFAGPPPPSVPVAAASQTEASSLDPNLYVPNTNPAMLRTPKTAAPAVTQAIDPSSMGLAAGGSGGGETGDKKSAGGGVGGARKGKAREVILPCEGPVSMYCIYTPVVIGLRNHISRQTVGTTKATDLRKELFLRGLNSSGRKDALVSRLWDAVSCNESARPTQADIMVATADARSPGDEAVCRKFAAHLSELLPACLALQESTKQRHASEAAFTATGVSSGQ